MSGKERERTAYNSLESDYSVDDSGTACIDIGIKRTLYRVYGFVFICSMCVCFSLLSVNLKVEFVKLTEANGYVSIG